MRAGALIVALALVLPSCVRAGRARRPPPRTLRQDQRVFLERIVRAPLEGGVASIAPAPDGKRIAIGSISLGATAADASGLEPVVKWRKQLAASDDVEEVNEVQVAWAADGRTMAVAHGRSGTVELWDTRHDRRDRTLELAGPVRALAWSPDGALLAAAVGNEVVLVRVVGMTVELAGDLEGHGAPVRAVAWSADGRTLASGGDDRVVRLWDPRKRALVKTLARQRGAIATLAWSPDGAMLAAGGADSRIQILSVASGQTAREVVGHGPVASLAWSPDGAMLATGGRLDARDGDRDGVLVLWNLTTLRPVELQIGPEYLEGLFKETEAVRAVAWSIDGRFLYYGTARELVVIGFTTSAR
jgi:WD40 repeat protein